MAIQGKLVQEITRNDIQELISNHAPEDSFIDFKQVIFHQKHKRPDDEICDLLEDLVSFANGYGGHIIIGVEDRGDRAWQLRPLSNYDARRVATKLKALAIQHIRPPMPLLEIVPFRMDDRADECVVLIAIPPGQAKPHMSSFGSQTSFTIRDGNRKRSMTADEILSMFLAGPQQSTLASIYAELRSVRALVEAEVIRRRPWWRFW